jgi:chromosomal replication initiation ATPase DnaA
VDGYTPTQEVVVTAIIHAAAAVHAVSVMAMRSKSSAGYLTAPRQSAAYLLDEIGMGAAEIGRRMGGRSHSAITALLDSVDVVVERQAEVCALRMTQINAVRTVAESYCGAKSDEWPVILD